MDTDETSKDGKKENKYSIFPQLLGAFGASLAATVIGASVGFSSVIIHQLQHDSGPLKITLDEGSWIPTLQGLSSTIFSITGGQISSKIGRRKTLIIFNIPIILCWIVTAVTQNIHVIYLTRLILGSSIGAFVSSIGIFIAETTHPDLRHHFSVFQAIFMSLGYVKAYAFGYLFPWRTLAWLQILEPSLCILILFFLPETPYWLLEKGYSDEAKESMQFFRGENYNIDSEMDEMARIKVIYSKRKSKGMKIIFFPSFYKRFFIIGILYGLSQCAGLPIMMNYMSNVFENAESSIDPLMAPIIVASFRLCASILLFFILRWSASKPLFIMGSFTMAIGNAIIASFSYLKTHGNPSWMEGLGWIPLFGVIVTLLGVSLGVISILHITLAEIYPTRYRGIACGITQAFVNFIKCINLMLYPKSLHWFHFYGTFYIYSGFGVIMGCWAIIKLPEHKGMSLSAVEESLAPELHD